jgi:hypothetical protein
MENSQAKPQTFHFQDFDSEYSEVEISIRYANAAS